MDRAEERKLIERAIAGERAAAGALVQQHQRSVYAYLLRMSGRPDVAEDMVQEAFVRVLTNIDRFDFRFRFSTWLFTIARRLFLNHMQKMKPAYDTDAVGATAGRLDAPGEPAAERDLQGVQRCEISLALQSLSTDQREVIVLFHQLDWTIGQISAHLDMPEGTVKSHLHRGRRRLREALATQPDVLSKLAIGAETDELVGVRREGDRG